MNKSLPAIAAVVAIAAAAAGLGGPDAARPLLAVAVPYAAFAALLLGLSWKVVSWSRVPVPFRITTVCGQQKSLPWIRHARLESPASTLGVIGRMALEVLAFRSLFRNTKSRVEPEPRMIHGEAKWLWLGAMAFHWSMLMILIRHLRLLVQPVPKLALLLEQVDGFFEVGVPVIYVTDIAILAGLLYLLQRRFRDPQVRLISLFTDYFALFLLIGVALTGVGMRYCYRVDAVAVKQFAIGLATFTPFVPKNLGVLFHIHLGLVCALAAYLPFSKLMHMGGVFLSPTRNLANDNRMNRHVNPWNYPVKVHTYEEWEEEFHDKIEAAGLPLERR